MIYMPKKKIEVVELNKKEEQIVLEETSSALVLFWRRHGSLLFSLLLTLSLLIFGVSLFLFIKNLNQSVDPIIKEVSVDISLTDMDTILGSDNAMTDESAKNAFANTGFFQNKGEVLLVKKVEGKDFTLKYYSDGTVIKTSKDGKNITRINPLSNGEYGVNEDGVIYSKAITSQISVTNTKTYPWGTVTTFSDNSAEVTNSKMDMFVRDSSYIHYNYISNNSVTYLKENKNSGGATLNYYYDGTIEVVKGGTSYVVRSAEDLNSGSGTFPNENAATIYATKKTSNGFTIDYYTDGGAIIRDGSKSISVRKSNSINIKGNNLYEIVDSIYVTESKKTDKATYYTNGGAVVNYDDKTLYVPENSDIKYSGNSISGIGTKTEKLVKETNISNENVKNFEKTAVVKTDKYTAILPKEELLFDSLGKVKDLDKTPDDENKRSFTITNNTNDLIHYRVVIERSDKTNLDTSYVRYQMSTRNIYVSPTKLNKNVWSSDKISKSLKVNGTNYILIEDSLEAYDSDEVTLMIWADYDTIPNSEMNKYFYGTIRVYAWTEDENE